MSHASPNWGGITGRRNRRPVFRSRPMKSTDPSPDLGCVVRCQINGVDHWLAERSAGGFIFWPQRWAAMVFVDAETAAALAGELLRDRVVEFEPVGSK